MCNEGLELIEALSTLWHVHEAKLGKLILQKRGEQNLLACSLKEDQSLPPLVLGGVQELFAAGIDEGCGTLLVHRKALPLHLSLNLEGCVCIAHCGTSCRQRGY